MSKKSRQRKQRRISSLVRREQLALQQDALTSVLGGNTIGDLINRMMVKKIADSTILPIPSQVLVSQATLPLAPSPTVTVPAHWPECPDGCDLAEWHRALGNHDYYLDCAKKDGDKPWFHYPKHQYQYSEFVYITPDMAQRLLDFNPVNRKIKMAHVDGLKRDILNHRWLQTHESIAVNKLGNMHDGQHRAVAIIHAGTGWPFYVTWNVPPEAIYATDSGDKRPINEKLGFLFPELKMTHKTAAMCRSMMWGLSNRGIRYTESEIAAFMIKHQKIINWTINSVRAYRSDLQAVIAKGMMWWGEEIVGPFVERLRSVQFTGDGDPAKALYLWLQNAKQQGRRTAYVSPVIYYKKTLAAMHAHAARRDAKRITAKEQDVFEWLPGWCVPEDAPCQGKVFIHTEQESA